VIGEHGKPPLEVSWEPCTEPSALFYELVDFDGEMADKPWRNITD
jgi:hypothetical protein